jgi:hypothetical protein
VHVIIINGSVVPQASTTEANDLKSLGYPVTALGDALLDQIGTTVVCREGSSEEALTLAKQINNASVAGTFPNPAPDNIDCVVTVGE